MSATESLGDRYSLGETIGYGGMSEVHIARDERLGRDVAIKILRPDLARDPRFYLRFRREAQNAASLNHPMIVSIFDTGESASPQGPMPYIVMEYVDGQTLREALQSGPIDTTTVLKWVADVADALDFSHHNGIVHRDVKPGNIMINSSGAVKVMDFGIARAISDATITATQTATVIGTAQYLSPEQARGETVDSRSDVYSLGCVLYELLTGSPPFTGETPIAIAYQHVREDPKPPSSVNKALSPDLDAVVLKAMSKNPANRYQSAAEMREDLNKILAGERPSAPRVMSESERNSLLSTGEDTAPSNRVPRAHGKPVSDSRPRPRAVFLWLALAVIAAIATAYVVMQQGVGPAYVRVPTVAGENERDATAALQNSGFHVKIEKVEDPTTRPGTVVRTAPSEGTPVPQGSDVSLYLSLGAGRVPVPDVARMSQADAIATLQKSNLDADLAQTAREPSAQVPKDTVIRTEPDKGTAVDKGGRVRLVISSGPGKVKVPPVVGLQIDDARTSLVSAELVTSTTDVDSTEPKGKVLSSNPPAGTDVDKGSPVVLTVSRGPVDQNGQVTMPNLTGMTEYEARDALRTAGLIGPPVVQRTQDVPGSILGLGGDQTKHGIIFAQTPEAGKKVPTLTTVSVEAYK